METLSTLVDIEGRLWAADPWEIMSNGKEEIQRMWPLAARASDYQEVVGQDVRYDPHGFFELKGVVTKIKFAMRYGTETKCEAHVRPLQQGGNRG